MLPQPKTYPAERPLPPYPEPSFAPKAAKSDKPTVRKRRRWVEGRILYHIVPAAAISTLGLAYLSDASLMLIVWLVGLGVTGCSLAFIARREDIRKSQEVRASAARDMAEIETLSDRMWELRESQEHFRGLIDALGDVVIHRDRAGRVVFVNRVFADLIDMPPEEILGKTLDELGVDLDISGDAAFAKGGQLRSSDVEIQTRDGRRWYSWIELSARDADLQTASHRAIARDITDRKTAETALIDARQRAEFASQAKSRFLATVSHEIRTPMNGIAGMARLLADTKLSPEQQTYVAAVSTSAGALIALIEDLLDFAKIEAGRLEPQVQAMSPRELADSVVELMASRAYDKGICLGCHVAADVPRMMDSDPGKLRQVLLNLVGNAIKFTASGGVQLSVTRTTRLSQPVLEIAVADSGSGISEDDRERIFGEFEQVDGTSTRDHGGVGLGLAISRRLVTSLGGSIRIDGRSGPGSIFTFSVPIVDPVEPDARNKIELAGKHFAILSSNEAEAAALVRTIETHGGEATIFGSVRQVMAQIPRCDAIMVDAGYGEAASKALRDAAAKGGQAVNAIIMIAPQDRVRLPEFRQLGYETFLPRPIRSDTLIRVLTSSLLHPMEARQTFSEGKTKGTDDALRVLVAEDNAINALLARSALTKAGHKVDVVNDGGAAVAAITGSSEAYDIVLMDLHIPVMDGLHAIEAIRSDEADRGLASVPILVLSADGQETTRHKTLAAGANGFIAKPLDPEQLERSVRMHALKREPI